MSKAALEVLLTAIGDYDALSAKVRSSGSKTLGNMVREGGEAAPYNFVFDEATFKNQIRAMLKDPKGLNFQKLSPNYVENICSKAYFNIKKELDKRNLPKGVVPSGEHSGKPYYIISGFANNHAQAGIILSKAFGGTQASGAFFEFLIQELSSYNNITYSASNNLFISNDTHEELDTKDLPGEVLFVMNFANDLGGNYKGYGLDVGHIIANIKNAFQIICLNAITNYKPAVRDKLTSEAAKKSLNDLLASWKAILDNDVSRENLYRLLKKEGFITGPNNFKEIMSGFIGQTIDFTRQLSTGEVHGHIKHESLVTNEAEIKALSSNVSQWVMAEYGKGNVSAGAGVEQTIAEHLRTDIASANKKLLQFFKNWMFSEKGNYLAYQSGKAGIKLPNPLEFEGSPTIKDMATKSIFDSLTLGKIKPERYSSSANKPTRLKIVPKPIKKSSSTTPINQDFKRTVPSIGKLRAPQGQFTSLVNVVNLINMQLAERIRQNMGSPGLNYRTGRFAKSAKVLAGSMDKDGVVRLPYTYMKYPYQTFEPGFAQGNAARDPKSLITKSVREIAQKLVTSRLRIVRV